MRRYIIVCRDIAILEMRLSKEPLSAQQISDMPRGTGVGDPTGILVVNKTDAEDRLPDLYKEKRDIKATVEAVQNDFYRQLLECRYIDCLSHKETAQVLHVSTSVVRNTQRAAIEAIEIKK